MVTLLYRTLQLPLGYDTIIRRIIRKKKKNYSSGSLDGAGSPRRRLAVITSTPRASPRPQSCSWHIQLIRWTLYVTARGDWDALYVQVVSHEVDLLAQ